VKITGLDLSLRKTGAAHVRLEREVLAVTARIIPGKALGEGHDRLDFVLREIGQHTRHSDLVLIEGLAHSQNTNKASELAGLHWLVRHGLWRRGIPYLVVITQHLKIYATGRGTRVDKDDVLAAMIRRYPDVEIAGNDGADALALAAMGADYMGQPLASVPDSHRRALRMITWPDRIQEMREAFGGSSDHPAA